ncbi:MAG: hypothetical protein ACKOPE_00030 [Novosphingobium sp.]
MRRPATGLILLALAGCSGGRGPDSYSLDMPLAEARQQVNAIAACPSPLQRLGIAAPPRRLNQPDDTAIDLSMAPKGGGEPFVIHFTLDPAGKNDGAPTRIRARFDLPEAAKELDLGEDRLIAPLVLKKELMKALEGYFNAAGWLQGDRVRNNDTGREAISLKRACSQLGRLLDDAAVIISPTLSTEIARQKHRDALGWLFQDNYKLRTDSPDGAYWEAPADYQPGWE